MQAPCIKPKPQTPGPKPSTPYLDPKSSLMGKPTPEGEVFCLSLCLAVAVKIRVPLYVLFSLNKENAKLMLLTRSKLLRGDTLCGMYEEP